MIDVFEKFMHAVPIQSKQEGYVASGKAYIRWERNPKSFTPTTKEL